MLKIIIITHGSFSMGIQNSAEMILGKQENIHTFSILENCDLRDVRNKMISELEDSKAKGEEVLFLTDVFFGTPFNLITPLMQRYEFHHITGINLPLLMEIISNQDAEDIPAMLTEAVALGKEAIVDCVNYFRSAMSE